MERTTYWVARPSSKVRDTTVGEAAMTRPPENPPPRSRRKVAARPRTATRRRRSVFNSSMVFNSDLLRLTVGAGPIDEDLSQHRERAKGAVEHEQNKQGAGREYQECGR